MSTSHPDPHEVVSARQAFERIYKRVRASAQTLLADYRGSTKQATDLAHDGALKVLRAGTYRSDAALYTAVLKAMKHALVDRHREKIAKKRGGGKEPQSLNEDVQEPIETSPDAKTFTILDAEARLTKVSPQLADIFRRVLFEQSDAEIAETLGLSVQDVERQRLAARNLLTSWIAGRCKKSSI